MWVGVFLVSRAWARGWFRCPRIILIFGVKSFFLEEFGYFFDVGAAGYVSSVMIGVFCLGWSFICLCWVGGFDVVCGEDGLETGLISKTVFVL